MTAISHRDFTFPLKKRYLRHAPNSARMKLNFLTGQLDSRITFSRGTGATRINPSGLIELVGNTTPRFDYDPVTLAPRGLLIEEARTNLLLNSLINGTNLSTQSVTVTAVAHTISFYGTGSITLSGAHTATINGAGAYPARQTLTFTPTAGTLTCTVSGTVQFAQLEVGSFATSFMPTAGSTVTRNADVPTMTGTNFSSWYNQSEGTFVVDSAEAASAVGSGKSFAVANAGNNGIIRGGKTNGATTAIAQLFNAGVEVGTAITSNSLSLGSPNKIAVGYKVNDFGISLNGGAVQVDTSVAIPTDISRLEIGQNAAGLFLNGHIRTIAYYNKRLSDTQLQALTR